MEKLLINDYDYPLTDERIAKYPLPERDHSKLLVYADGKISEDRFFHVGEYIAPESLLVYNNTRVIPARIVFYKESGARIEIFCLEPLNPKDYQLALSTTEACVWKCMIGNLKKWKTGVLTNGLLHAELISTTGNTHEVKFWWDDTDKSFAEMLDGLGELPIPPYLNRPTEESDKTTYQTVYSRIKGSVAAPTAGLHFTNEVLDDLRGRGIKTTELTLHVGAGTFQPVKVEDANEHVMHTEIISVPRQTIQEVKDNLGHIVAVGTTSMRTLESLYYIGVQIHDFAMQFPYEDCKPSDFDWSSFRYDLSVTQFEPYEKDPYLRTDWALQRIISYLDATNQDTLHAQTQIMIKPGYQFHVVDQLITNFHQPKSTLLLLVSAFVGEDWKNIYDYALSHDFRFLSYGDSSILTRHD